nr:pyridoxine 5'-phosphate synthase [Marinicella sp. W31]MDC2877350.1 pyridoxine 5'-phosphate synthase [Marinicella sp. W31]
MVARLSVNLNAIAQLRNRRDLPWPSVRRLGRIALAAGAYGLTVHPRPDQRHIRFSDLAVIRALIDDEFPEAEFNIEGFPSDHFMGLCLESEPEQVTLVPDDPAQSTSDHGWDFIANVDLLKRSVGRLKKKGIRVSLFADGDASQAQLEAARESGADRVELYTGPYGGAFDEPERQKVIATQLGETAALALEAGLGVNAGHDLTVGNLPLLAGRIPIWRKYPSVMV